MCHLKKILKRLFGSSLGLVIITIFFYGIFVGQTLWRNGFDFSHFIIAGNIFVNSEQLTEPIKILKKCGPEERCGGYDGQFYYRLALDPLTNKRTDYGVTIDLPALRHQRILYPVLVRIFSLGINSAVPIIMVLLNLVALGLMAYFAGKIMKKLNYNIYWGLLIPFYPGFLFTLARDLTEILGICLLTIAFFFLLKERKIAFAVSASLAVLARETTLIFALGFLVAYLYQVIFQKEKLSFKLFLIYLSPILVFLLWQLILAWVWPRWAINSSIYYNITWPFAGLVYHIKNGRLLNRQNLIEIFYLLFIITSAAWAYLKTKIDPGVKFSFLIALIIFMLISKSIWIEDWSYMRAFSELYFFSVLITIFSQDYLKKYAVVFSLIMWLVLYKIALVGWLFG